MLLRTSLSFSPDAVTEYDICHDADAYSDMNIGVTTFDCPYIHELLRAAWMTYNSQ